MSLTIPTTQELADQNLTGLEGAVAQTSPLNDKAFLRVLAVMEALAMTGLYKYAVERAKQNLALTASGEGLADIGEEYATIKKPAEAARLIAVIPAQDGLTVDITATFTGDSNGVRYTMDAAAVSVGGYATISLTADEVGTIGNLQAGDSLSIVSQIAGVGNAATVTAVANTGAEEETDDAYAPRVLFAERATKGGGNATDYKMWTEEVAGVLRGFPYAGKPAGSVDPSYPGDRTVYVEADTSIDPDGIPTGGLLGEVRAALNADPATGKSRPGLGLIDSTLFVEPITRTAVTFTVTNLVAPAGTEASVRASIESAASLFLLALAPYIEGIDLPQDRNDRITIPAASNVVQGVLTATGGTAASVTFSIGGTPYSTYQLSPGQRSKLGAVNYVTV